MELTHLDGRQHDNGCNLGVSCRFWWPWCPHISMCFYNSWNERYIICASRWMGFNIYVRIDFGFNNYLQKDCQPCKGLFFQFCNEVKMAIYHPCKVIMANLATNKKCEWKEMKHPSILFAILFDFNTIFSKLSVLSIKP